MPVAVRPATYGGSESFRKFTVAEYNRMIAAGILDDEDAVELLEGHVVLKMPRDPRHDSTIQRMIPLVFPLCPAGWSIRVQSAVTLSESQPEPDFALVRGSADDYEKHHPYPDQIGFVIEVANSSLQRDTLDKTRVYAADGIPEYWVVNLVDRRIEVYSQPTGPAPVPAYAGHRIATAGDTLPITLDGRVVGTVAVSALLP